MHRYLIYTIDSASLLVKLKPRIFQVKKNRSTQSYGQSNKSNSKFNGNNRSYRTANSKRAATSQKGTTNQPSKLVFIAGDSIVQHVHGWELSDAER